MNNIKDLTTAQLQRIIAIKQQIEGLESELDSIGGGNGVPSPFSHKPRKKHRMSRAGRAKIAAAARARWAKYRGKAVKKSKPAKKKRKVSAAVKAKLRAIAKARWAKVKAEGKKGL